VIAWEDLSTRWRPGPKTFDALLAALVLLLALFAAEPDAPPTPERLNAPAVVLAVAGSAALLARRRNAVAVLVVTTAATVATMLLLDTATGLVVAALVALGTVAARTDRRTTWLAFAVTAAALCAAAVVIEGRGSWYTALLQVLPWVGGAAAAGDALRNRRAYVAAVEERALRAELTRDEEARRRVAEERLRIARELHDVVAHHIAVINVQAGVAAHLVQTRPEAAVEALGHVRRASQSVLEELGGILTVLRQPGEAEETADAPRAPAPGLAQIEGLVASFAAAGLDVDWSLTGAPSSVGDAVDLVAYRVLEEALTNAHKHGRGSAHVSVEYAASAVSLAVVNEVGDGSRSPGSGFGLLGMRERAGAVGGTLRTGTGADGTFHVEAVLPRQESVA
jgi:signal transduction histidine kinase